MTEMLETMEVTMDTPDETTEAPEGVAAIIPPRLEVSAAAARSDPQAEERPIKLSVRNLDFFYGKEQALFGNSIEIHENRVTAIIGPSGWASPPTSAPTTESTSSNRDQRASGEVLLDGKNLLSSSTDVLALRQRVGMIFQKPSPSR